MLIFQKTCNFSNKVSYKSARSRPRCPEVVVINSDGIIRLLGGVDGIFSTGDAQMRGEHRGTDQRRRQCS